MPDDKDQSALPPSVAAAIAEVFTNGPFVSEPTAAVFLGVSSTTLRREAERGAISYRLRGKRRCYAQEDIEAYLTRSAQPTGKAGRGSRATRNRPVSVQASSHYGSGSGGLFDGLEGKALYERLKAQKKARRPPL